MKMTQLSTPTKNVLLGIFTILAIFTFTSCAKKMTFLTSPVVPAARGYVKVKNDNNKNYVIQIELLDLAEATRLSPAKQTYVVWMVTDKETTKNIGKLNSGTSMMSNRLKASFETVSALKPSKIFITAEDDPSTQSPGMQVVLSTDRF